LSQKYRKYKMSQKYKTVTRIQKKITEIQKNTTKYHKNIHQKDHKNTKNTNISQEYKNTTKYQKNTTKIQKATKIQKIQQYHKKYKNTKIYKKYKKIHNTKNITKIQNTKISQNYQTKEQYNKHTKMSTKISQEILREHKKTQQTQKYKNVKTLSLRNPEYPIEAHFLKIEKYYRNTTKNTTKIQIILKIRKNTT